MGIIKLKEITQCLLMSVAQSRRHMDKVGLVDIVWAITEDGHGGEARHGGLEQEADHDEGGELRGHHQGQDQHRNGERQGHRVGHNLLIFAEVSR